MDYRIEMMVKPQWHDARGAAVLEKIRNFFKKEVQDLRTRDVFTVSADITAEQADQIGHELSNPVLQNYLVGESSLPEGVNFVVAVGFRPGVTDNVARTAREAIGDIIGRRLAAGEDAYSSVEYLFTAPALNIEDIKEIADGLLANKLIETVTVMTADEVKKNGMPLNKPVVNGVGGGEVRTINLSVSDEELVNISKKGTLALTLEEMKSIQNYFHSAENREKYGLTKEPTDVELEVLAQTWSEHCKHKIFSAEVEYTDEDGKKETFVSLYKTFIKNGTKEVAKKIDWLVSVFTDNAGVIKFNDKFDLAYKVETHNSPSALDPYGGAMTGIVGVNRDPMGTGQGAELLINVWGYCFGSPFTADENVPEGLLHPRRLRDGVHKGVIDGGNQSGIPYGNGWEFFDDRYIGKPLVYCGTVGRLPKNINGIPGASKSIEPGDLIVMGGGRIGKDGIHGATFSSEELHKDSPVQAVQIGDPITQKKMSDFMVEARNRSLYRFITDNGAGGLSSSVGEMAELCNGCRLDLAKAPLKYAGLQPWEILVSEAQERMSFAVPPEKIDEFKRLAAERDVEVTVLGEFTDNGKFHILYNDKTVALIDIEFMHTGLPQMSLKARWERKKFDEPEFAGRCAGADMVSMLGRLNIASDEFKARQYDHEVKGLSVVKPFVGVGRDIAGDATVTMIEPLSTEGIILASAILPHHGDIDTYWMTASSIDLAVRRVLSVGGSMDRIAGLDNFCWPDPVQSEKTPDGEYKLAQLVRANEALYEYTKKYVVPCISGKDSMKNDSTRGGRKISIPPSLLFSVISKMNDIRLAVTPDVKKAGDILYVIGDTKPEMGGSEYYSMLGATGNRVPEVDAQKFISLYKKVEEATSKRLFNSLITPGLGGLSVAFAKSAMAGRLGLDIELDKIPASEKCSDIELLFSESNGRFVATVSADKAAEFEAVFAGYPVAKAGVVTADEVVRLKSGNDVCEVTLDSMLRSYKGTLDNI